MWDPPAWWSWLWASACVVLIAAWYLDVARRRRLSSPLSAHRARTGTSARRLRAGSRATEPQDRSAPRSDAGPIARPALVPSVAWQPVPEPMGPVSGWPHALDAPDAPASGSPEDRPDL